MKKAYKTSEIAEAMGKTKRWVQRVATREAWPFTKRPCLGGWQKCFPFEKLPIHRQKELAEKLNIVPSYGVLPLEVEKALGEFHRIALEKFLDGLIHELRSFKKLLKQKKRRTV